MTDLLQLLALYRRFKDAIAAGDWATILDLVGDVFKLTATLMDDTERPKMMAMLASTNLSGLTDEEKSKLDPATIALIVQLISMGMDLLVKLIKRRRGL